MKRQTIYPMLVAVLAAVSVTQVHAQTRETNVSETRIRRLLSGGGTENKEIRFGPSGVNSVQTRLISSEREVSPNSSQELRALIFENYTPTGSKGAGLRATKTPQVLQSSGTVELPSDSSAAETTKTTKKEESPVQTPPTQGNAKEEQ